MFIFNFKKDNKKIKVDVKVKEVSTLKQLKREAEKEAEEKYRQSIISGIKDDLMKQYEIDRAAVMMIYNSDFYDEYKLLNAIIGDMVDQLELID